MFKMLGCFPINDSVERQIISTYKPPLSCKWICSLFKYMVELCCDWVNSFSCVHQEICYQQLYSAAWI